MREFEKIFNLFPNTFVISIDQCKASDAAKESVFDYSPTKIQYRDDDRSRRGAHGKWGNTIVGGR